MSGFYTQILKAKEKSRKRPSLWTRIRLWFCPQKISWDIGTGKSVVITYKTMGGITYIVNYEEIYEEIEEHKESA